eukprot:4304829-Amphidinium_carterae.1
MSISHSTSGCLGKGSSCAEELVPSAAWEKRLTALRSFGRILWDTWSSWTWCGGEHAAGKRLQKERAAAAALRKRLSSG